MDTTRRGSLGLGVGLAASAFASPVEAAAGAPALAERPMVARVWHGRVPVEKVDAYRQYLFEAGVKRIAALPGNRGVQMWVAAGDGAGDFTVVSYWDSVDAIRGYAGADYTRVHDLPRDREFLIAPEALVHHFEVDVNFWQA